MRPRTSRRLRVDSGWAAELDLAHSESVAMHALLFDPEEHLFYRDAEDIGERTPNGEKVLWSRGNGWAFAGLANSLTLVPPGHPSRQFYLDLFREMAPALLEAQQPDGLWSMSLLDPEQVPIGETSGSALILYGMAFGVNEGILDRETYLPVVERGWAGLLTRIGPDGEVDYVQPVGEVPALFDPANSEPFGTGAVLAAGSYIVLLLNAIKSPAELRAEAESLADGAPDLSRDEE